MLERYFAVPVALVMALVVLLPSASAVTLNSFSLDKSSYNAGDQGTATLVFFNDEGALIRITSVDLSFNYFYQDGRVYVQDFIVSGLSMNVTDSTLSQSINVKFSLPSDIASGYFVPSIRVTFNELVNPGSWSGSRQDNMAATRPLYVQSLQYQSAVTLQYLFIVTTVLFAGVAFYFAMRYFALKTPTRNDK